MDFEKVLSLRQAVRAYTDEPVSEEQLKAILNAAYRAPVGMHNFAGYHLTVITRPELLALMVDTARKVTGKDNNPLYGAPAFILVRRHKGCHSEDCRSGCRLHYGKYASEGGGSAPWCCVYLRYG